MFLGVQNKAGSFSGDSQRRQVCNRTVEVNTNATNATNTTNNTSTFLCYCAIEGAIAFLGCH